MHILRRMRRECGLPSFGGQAVTGRGDSRCTHRPAHSRRMLLRARGRYGRRRGAAAASNSQHASFDDAAVPMTMPNSLDQALPASAGGTPPNSDGTSSEPWVERCSRQFRPGFIPTEQKTHRHRAQYTTPHERPERLQYRTVGNCWGEDSSRANVVQPTQCVVVLAE